MALPAAGSSPTSGTSVSPGSVRAKARNASSSIPNARCTGGPSCRRPAALRRRLPSHRRLRLGVAPAAWAPTAGLPSRGAVQRHLRGLWTQAPARGRGALCRSGRMPRPCPAPHSTAVPEEHTPWLAPRRRRPDRTPRGPLRLRAKDGAARRVERLVRGPVHCFEARLGTVDANHRRNRHRFRLLLMPDFVPVRSPPLRGPHALRGDLGYSSMEKRRARRIDQTLMRRTEHTPGSARTAPTPGAPAA